jgi:hypothetical protein
MTSTVERSTHEIARSRPVEIGARVGLFAYGVTHLLIAWLALRVAFGGSGQQASQSGAFQELAQQPLGRVLLWVIAVGFVAVVLWRAALAIWGFSYESGFTKIRKRVSSGARAAVFAALAVAAGSTAVGGGGGGGGQKAAAGVLGLPGGQLLIGAVGIGIAVSGVVKIVAGWQQKFRDDMDLPSDEKARATAVRLGQVGFIAKGFSVVMIGGLLVTAAIRFRPEEANGLDSALKALAAQPFGPYLLTLVALGLAAYGLFCFFDARYHRV